MTSDPAPVPEQVLPATATAEPAGRPAPPRPATLALVLLASLTAFALCAALVLARNAGFIDQPVLREAVASRHPLLDGPMTVVTHASKVPLLIVTVAGALLMSWRSRSWRPLLLVGGTGALSVAVATLVKEITDRARPPATLWAIPEEGFCFPSRHTVIATAVLLILAYVLTARLTSRTARLLTWGAAFALATLVGVSRVYLGVHWATDVLAGLALGTAVTSAVITGDVLFPRPPRRP